jgi:argininosuccinate lyase
MVRKLLAEGRDFSSMSLAEWRQASELFGDDAPQAATPLESVYAKRTPQSTNPDCVEAALKECRDWLANLGISG